MRRMYADYSLNTIIFREKFSFKFDISAQNSDGGCAKMHKGGFALLVGGQGETVMLCIFLGWLAEGGGVRGDGGAADDYLVATENHVDEC